MAIGGRRGGTVRDIRALATRVYRRWLEYSRRHIGMSVPVDDTLSRIFEHVPEYRPLRARASDRQDRAAKSPGVFKLQEVADRLETTVGDLLGEPGYESARELLSASQRRMLRDSVRLLRDLFDLEDEALDDEARPPLGSEYRFAVAPEDFIERDHDYPRALHAWMVPVLPAMAGNTGAEPELALTTAQILHSVREVWDSRLQVLRVIGDSMAPELLHGWKVLVDTQQTQPADGALVAVYLKDEGGLLGRWQLVDGKPSLRKSNPDYAAVDLPDPGEWTVWGTVTTIVEAPVELRSIPS